MALSCFLWAMLGSVYADGNGHLLPQHYLGVSVGGGYAQNIMGSGTTYLCQADTAVSEGGYGVHVGLQYELAYRHWFFGFGCFGRFHRLQDTVRNFIDRYGDVEFDKNGAPLNAYEYVYRNRHGTDQIGMLSIPLYVGRDIGEWIYLKVGVTFSVPLYARYTARAAMYTQGIYKWGWELYPILSSAESANNFEESHSYYFEESYSASQTYKDLLRIGLDGEIGAYLLRDKTGAPSMQTRLRLGMYVSSDFRIGEVARQGLVDYSSLDAVPYLRTKAQLHEDLLFTPITHTELFHKMPPTLEVGVRLTCLFNVSRKQKICRCVNYLY